MDSISRCVSRTLTSRLLSVLSRLRPYLQSEVADTIDAAEAEIFDSYLMKYWALKYGTQAACTILQVDQIILAKRAGGPKPPQNAGADDD